MFDYVKKLEIKYEELEGKMCESSVSDEKNFHALAKELASLRPTVELYRKYKKIASEKEKNLELLYGEKDPQMKELIVEENIRMEKELSKIENEIIVSLLPRDENDGKNIIVEVRAGAGGHEAAIFVADLFKMYSRFASMKNLDTDVMSSSPTDLEGFKEVVFMVRGKDAWKHFQFESGVHRVQRVPITEASGRIHTSTVSVAVLVEAADVEVEIDEKDLRIDTYRSSGAGGQHVNKTDSAVRITHFPSGIVVACQEERSQIKNRVKAMKLLKAKLLDRAKEERQSAIANLRKKQIGTGDRSEKIRTYNYPQNRITDHRINYSVYNLPKAMEGYIDELLCALVDESQKEKLQALVV